MTRAYFSLGSNIADRAAYLALGVSVMAADHAHRVSRVYETEPVGGVVQDDFWNLVLEVQTTESPRRLLERVRVAEEAATRTRQVRWGPRTLDVDIVWIDDGAYHDEELTVPHPRLYERNFVLVPLRELRPDLVSEDDLRAAHGAVRILGTLDSLH